MVKPSNKITMKILKFLSIYFEALLVDFLMFFK